MSTNDAAGEEGVALVAALLVMMLLSALGLSLTMVTSTERRVAATHGDGAETLYAADAALELVLEELAGIPDWSRVLDGSTTSSFFDASRTAVLSPDGRPRTKAETTALVTCGLPACTDASMDASTAERPWGANNPRWRLYACGWLRDIAGAGAVDSDDYVAVWVGDDPSENDGRPLVDGDTSAGPNPGLGIVTVLVHAYGPSGTRRVVEATVARAPPGVRLLSWRLD